MTTISTIERPEGRDGIAITPAGQWTTRVLLDPAGNEFCVIGADYRAIAMPMIARPATTR